VCLPLRGSKAKKEGLVQIGNPTASIYVFDKGNSGVLMDPARF